METSRIKYVVGIVSYNEVDQIPFVLSQVDQGLSSNFNPQECLILNLDSGSTDGTREAFLNSPTICQKEYIKTPMGKGRAMLWLFRFCVRNSVPCVATVDADLKSITPEWVYKLLKPIELGFDFVVPVYQRNRFEANITNHFAYPLLYANFGLDLRQPLGGEFGYSLSFCKYLIKQNKHPKTYKYGIDIFVSAHALTGGFKIAETHLNKKIHAPSFFHMERTFREVSESGMFVTRDILRKGVNLSSIKRSRRCGGINSSTFYAHKAILPKLQKQLRSRFVRYKDAGLYEKYILNKLVLEQINQIIRQNDTQSLEEELWIGYVHALLQAYYQNNYDNKVLQTLSRITIPIYRWRALTYWLESEKLSAEKAEKILNTQALLLRKKVEEAKK